MLLVNLRKYILAICFLFALSMMVSIYVSAETTTGTILNESSSDVVALMGKIGQAERKIMDRRSTGSDLYARGKTIAINRKEVEIIKARYDVEGVSDGEERAYQYLIRREALLQIALKSGAGVSEAEAREYVDRQKTAIENISDDPAYAAYLNGLGMSVSEYWDSQYEILKNELITGKYLETEKIEYAKKHNISNWTADELNGWKAYLDQMAEGYIQNDDVKRSEQICIRTGWDRA